MPKITPFNAIRPHKNIAPAVAALPYDVYNRTEAAEIIKKEPLSFLRIDRPETSFPDEVGTYDDRVYLKANQIFQEMLTTGSLIKDDNTCYYIYELTMDNHIQSGIVACQEITDYENGLIKKHENTRTEKEIDRIRHMDALSAHTGPIFMAYRSLTEINEIVSAQKKAAPEYDFIADDGIRHRVFRISQTTTVNKLKEAFAKVPATYIADGHHRCASAVKVGLKRKAGNPNHRGDEEYNRFLSVLFPHDQLKVLPYNRTVTDLNGHSKDEFIAKIKNQGFTIEHIGKKAYAPTQKGSFGMYLADNWYNLSANPKLRSDDPINGLDVAILQDYILKPLLGIDDPRTSKRIDFIGGIRGLSELEKRVATDMQVAFSLHATSIEELFKAADANLLMPPKSTWFEPKLRSGLFIHAF